MQRCNSVDDAIFCSNNCRRGINSPGAFTIQNRLFAGGVRSNGAQNFSIEDRMPLDGSGCHVRLSRFLFLFFFFFFFSLPCPVATVSKADERTGTSSNDHLRTIETPLPFFSASLHPEKSERRTKRRIRLSRRLGSFPILSDT